MVSLGYGFKSYVGCRIKQVWLHFLTMFVYNCIFLCLIGCLLLIAAWVCDSISLFMVTGFLYV